MSDPPAVMAAKTYSEGATTTTRNHATVVPASASAKATAKAAGFPGNKWVPVSATAAKKPSSRPATPVSAAAAARGTTHSGTTGRQPRRAPPGKRLIRPDVPRQLPSAAKSGLTAGVGFGRSVSQGHIDVPVPNSAALLESSTSPANALPSVGSGRGESSSRLQRVRNRLNSAGATGDTSLSVSASVAATAAGLDLSARGAGGPARTARRSIDDDAVGRKSEDFRHAQSRRQLAAAVKGHTAHTGKDGAVGGQQSGRGTFSMNVRRLKRNSSTAVPAATPEDIRRSGSASSGHRGSSNGAGGGSPGGTMSSDCVVARSAVPYSSVFPVQEEQVGPKHFEKMRLLGEGSIGKVYLVRLRGTDRYYAMKELTKRDMIERNKIKRVMTEREILVTAHHPFIVTMYASFQTHNTLSFVMEHCEGGEFFRVLQKQPNHRLKESSARFYAAEVLLALEYLHHIGFIYRDLKPENVLMRANGHIALTDFDLSKEATPVSPRIVSQHRSLMKRMTCRLPGSSSPGGSRIGGGQSLLDMVESEPELKTSSTSFVGTAEYLSPEIIKGETQTSAVDWWTLGVLIYEMVCGQTPFYSRGDDNDDTFAKVVDEKVKLTWPSDVHVSSECKSLVKGLLRRDPAKRLGVGDHGGSSIKRAPWFKDIDFAALRHSKPPIIPGVPRLPKRPVDGGSGRGSGDSGGGDESNDSEDEAETGMFPHFSSRRDLSKGPGWADGLWDPQQ
ncbi:hypothetical protein MMPV_007605 [Pyropia vietnamensis]